ncbi:MAG: fructosamine kinase family protein [Methyloceanibacter sp.]
MSDDHLKTRLQQALGSRVVEARPLPVGFGITGLAITLADGRRLAVKAGEADRGGGLELEAFMLGELARLSELPVPRVHHAARDLLVMDFIENDAGGISESVECHAGLLIARLHATPRERFGYPRDTLIGPLHQPNPQTSFWVPFFRDHRLLYMAREAHREGCLPSPLLTRIERLAERIENYLIEPPFPSLLHGDLWTGNVLVREGRIAGFVDLAISCGHPEIELAFATMFGTFGKTFFEVYESLVPLEPGFHEIRASLYNLYPSLVHVRLFGASYLAGIERTLARIGL